MKVRMENSSPLFKMIFNNVINLPTPTSINYLWNMGSMLGFTLLFQILTGVFLSMHYSPSMAFDSVVHIIRNVWMGSEVRFMHSNGASLFFILIYVHIYRGLVNFSFKKKEVWFSGIIIFLILMGTAFLGYVLPWGQMSFWGATVITNLASTVPILGLMIVQWLWGGFSVSDPTLNRFFALHFLFPFVLMGLVMVHLIMLHSSGSSNPIGLNSNQEKLNFHPFFSWKDLVSPFIIFLLMFILVWGFPYVFMDPENFSLANPMTTPIHIQPEWYFLFAYALLRSISNKLGGVMVLLMSILLLFLLPMKKNINMNTKFNPVFKFKTILFSISFLILTWLGAKPMEPPYMIVSSFMGPVYFFLMLV